MFGLELLQLAKQAVVLGVDISGLSST